jgi:FAD/FMN-containing dehydrogenase
MDLHIDHTRLRWAARARAMAGFRDATRLTTLETYRTLTSKPDLVLDRMAELADQALARSSCPDSFHRELRRLADELDGVDRDWLCHLASPFSATH